MSEQNVVKVFSDDHTYIHDVDGLIFRRVNQGYGNIAYVNAIKTEHELLNLETDLSYFLDGLEDLNGRDFRELLVRHGNSGDWSYYPLYLLFSSEANRTYVATEANKFPPKERWVSRKAKHVREYIVSRRPDWSWIDKRWWALGNSEHIGLIRCIADIIDHDVTFRKGSVLDWEVRAEKYVIFAYELLIGRTKRCTYNQMYLHVSGSKENKYEYTFDDVTFVWGVFHRDEYINGFFVHRKDEDKKNGSFFTVSAPAFNILSEAWAK